MKKYYFLLLLVLLGLMGCKKNGQTLISVERNEDLVFTRSEFRLDLVKIIIKDKNDIIKVSLTEDMLSPEDFAKLYTVGVHDITVNYLGISQLIKITINNDVELIKIYPNGNYKYPLSTFKLDLQRI